MISCTISREISCMFAIVFSCALVLCSWLFIFTNQSCNHAHARAIPSRYNRLCNGGDQGSCRRTGIMLRLVPCDGTAMCSDHSTISSRCQLMVDAIAISHRDI